MNYCYVEIREAIDDCKNVKNCVDTFLTRRKDVTETTEKIDVEKRVESVSAQTDDYDDTGSAQEMPMRSDHYVPASAPVFEPVSGFVISIFSSLVNNWSQN
jgi:hypothetical protein